MNSKLLKTCSAMAIFGAMTVNTQAATIWLEPEPNVDINVGGVAPYELWADASDVGGFLAGGLDLFYDSTVLTYDDNFAFDPGFDTDPAFSRPGDKGDSDNCFADPSIAGCSGPGEVNGIAFGNFGGLADTGPTLVGSLSFSGLALGVSPLTMEDNDTPAGAWFATDGSGPLDVDYAVVPVPAAAWLMSGGLGMLLGFARKRKAA
jgi:hypothetical protein